jgi:hypothetical protein
MQRLMKPQRVIGLPEVQPRQLFGSPGSQLRYTSTHPPQWPSCIPRPHWFLAKIYITSFAQPLLTFIFSCQSTTVVMYVNRIDLFADLPECKEAPFRLAS